MLESLCQDASTIHELNLDGAFPERAAYRPQAVYEALKRTPLYDREDGHWKWSMSETQMLQDTDRGADAQLFGVLVEAQFNPDGALPLYEKVKATPLYDAARGQWNDYMCEEQRLRGMDRNAAIQLQGVLAEVQLNPKKAWGRYAQVKATPLYDPERGQWNWSMSPGQKVQERDSYADAQLLGVLVEAQFDKEAARVSYERLKATSLYDPERGQWNWWMSEEQVLLGTDRYAAAQLIGVLVEAQFDSEQAQALYEQLKTTPLYDPEYGQWNYRMSAEQELCDPDRLAAVQLLGVLVEAKLLSTLPRPLAEAVPPLPVTEDW